MHANIDTCIMVTIDVNFEKKSFQLSVEDLAFLIALQYSFASLANRQGAEVNPFYETKLLQYITSSHVM